MQKGFEFHNWLQSVAYQRETRQVIYLFFPNILFSYSSFLSSLTHSITRSLKINKKRLLNLAISRVQSQVRQILFSRAPHSEPLCEAEWRLSGDILRTGLILAINLTWELNVSRLTMSLRYSWIISGYVFLMIFNIRQIYVCGQLVHSRKRGDGLVDNAGKMNTILRYVETIISNDAWHFLPSKNSMMRCLIKFSWTILMIK